MKTDAELKRDVEAELKWTPDVDDTDIAVKVTGGEVTLTGYVPRHSDKFRAGAAVSHIKGVVAVANDIQVKAPLGAPSDPEIARDAVYALRLALPLTFESVTAVVNQGHVSLQGTLEWHYQREKAEDAVRNLPGVLGVRNSIRIKPVISPSNIKHQIEAAFKRQATLDANHLVVEATGSEVVLRGEVRSWSERDQAQQTAWAAPGVASVKNELTIRT